MSYFKQWDSQKRAQVCLGTYFFWTLFYYELITYLLAFLWLTVHFFMLSWLAQPRIPTSLGQSPQPSTLTWTVSDISMSYQSFRINFYLSLYLTFLHPLFDRRKNAFLLPRIKNSLINGYERSSFNCWSSLSFIIESIV